MRTPERSHLQKRRAAAWCLNTLCRETHHLGTKSAVFIPDNRDNWEVVANQVTALIENEPVAILSFEGNCAIVHIPFWLKLIRREHWADFNPGDHDILFDNRIDPVSQEPYNDGEYRITVPDNIPGYDLPEQPMPRRSRSQPFKVIASN